MTYIKAHHDAFFNKLNFLMSFLKILANISASLTLINKFYPYYPYYPSAYYGQALNLKPYSIALITH